jgi:hypothetical protein
MTPTLKPGASLRSCRALAAIQFASKRLYQLNPDRSSPPAERGIALQGIQSGNGRFDFRLATHVKIDVKSQQAGRTTHKTLLAHSQDTIFAPQKRSQSVY